MTLKSWYRYTSSPIEKTNVVGKIERYSKTKTLIIWGKKLQMLESRTLEVCKNKIPVGKDPSSKGVID